MAVKISVVIPNYNGRDLLAKNLPSVIKDCPNSEIIVVDDASQDDSVRLLRKKFKKVRLIALKKNVGFAKAVNAGVKKSTGSLILLLNSDVSPRSNFLKPAVNHFKNKDLFAVALCDYSHESQRIIIKGRGGAYFKKGFLYHFPAFIERGITLWVSGGSGLFDKEKFLKLGGFDDIYAPFYWEDIDLSFRAWRYGYKCIFEPLSKVDHFHEEGAIIKQKSKLFVRAVSYKNQFIFVWKNIYDYLLIIQHLLWLPYHFVRAIFNLNIAFFIGFVWAILSIPKLVFNYPSTQKFCLSEKEVLGYFEK